MMHDDLDIFAIPMLLVLAGCTEAPNLGSIRNEQVHISTTRWVTAAPAQTVIVLVVDDTPDPQGAALRESLVSAARLQYEPVPPTPDACPGSLGDALVYHPMDVRFAIIHPSASAGERLHTPYEIPALARTGEINDFVAYSAWQDAIRTAIRATPAVNGTYALIESVEDTLTVALLAAFTRGCRPASRVTPNAVSSIRCWMAPSEPPRSSLHSTGLPACVNCVNSMDQTCRHVSTT